MSSIEELEQRVAALEQRLDMESGLRASVDRDLSDLAKSVSAQRHLVQALAITQSEHTDKLNQVITTQSQHTETLALTRAALDQIVAMLTQLLNEEPKEPTP